MPNNMKKGQKSLDEAFGNNQPPQPDDNSPGMFSRIMSALAPAQASASADLPPPQPTSSPTLDDDAKRRLMNGFNGVR